MIHDQEYNKAPHPIVAALCTFATTLIIMGFMLWLFLQAIDKQQEINEKTALYYYERGYYEGAEE